MEEVKKTPRYDFRESSLRVHQNQKAAPSSSESDEENQDKETTLTASESVVENKVEGHHCCICSQTFSKPSNVKAHIRSVHLKIKYLCPQEECAEDFSNSSSLRRHLQRRHFEEESQLSALVGEQEYTIENGNYIRSEKAKLSKIARLTAAIKQQNDIIQKLEKNISTKKVKPKRRRNKSNKQK